MDWDMVAVAVGFLTVVGAVVAAGIAIAGIVASTALGVVVYLRSIHTENRATHMEAQRENREAHTQIGRRIRKTERRLGRRIDALGRSGSAQDRP